MFCIPKIDTQYACDFISLQILLKHFQKKKYHTRTSAAVTPCLQTHFIKLMYRSDTV